MKLFERWVVGTLLVHLFAAASGPVWAEDAENYIKYRQNYMKALGGHMGSAAQIVRGKVSPEGQLLVHAEAIEALSKGITPLFPEGSDFGETEAKEEIWQKWEEFETAAGDSAMAATAFREAVASGDSAAAGEPFRALSDACKGCHKKFRVEEE